MIKAMGRDYSAHPLRDTVGFKLLAVHDQSQGERTIEFFYSAHPPREREEQQQWFEEEAASCAQGEKHQWFEAGCGQFIVKRYVKYDRVSLVQYTNT